MKRNIIAGAVVVAVLAGGVATAQTGNNGNPSIVQLLESVQASVGSLAQSLQTSLAGLQTTLTSIQSSLANLQAPAQSNMRFTHPIFIGDDQGVLCAVTNVASAERTVTVEVLNSAGVSALASGNPMFTVNLQAGHATAGSVGLARGIYYCKFTVVDGTRNDMRGSLEHLLGRPNNAIGTVVPAE
jgi:hypothetical protein